jgi:hypothetical protein
MVKRVGEAAHGGANGGGMASAAGSPFSHGGAEVVSDELVEVVTPRWD